MKWKQVGACHHTGYELWAMGYGRKRCRGLHRQMTEAGRAGRLGGGCVCPALSVPCGHQHCPPLGIQSHTASHAPPAALPAGRPPLHAPTPHARWSRLRPGPREQDVRGHRIKRTPPLKIHTQAGGHAAECPASRARPPIQSASATPPPNRATHPPTQHTHTTHPPTHQRGQQQRSKNRSACAVSPAASPGQPVAGRSKR